MSSESEIEEYALVESIIRARAETVDGQLGWRYNVKWVGQSVDEASWLYDSDFDEQTQWIIDQFWANLEGGLDQRDYSEGDFVYAKQAWLDKIAAAHVRVKQAATKSKPRQPPPPPPPPRRRKSDDSDDDSDPFFRRKHSKKKKRSSPPTRPSKATPLKQQKLDFSKAPSSSRAADSSSPMASSSRLPQSNGATRKASPPAIIISSSSEDDTPTRPPPPASAAGKPTHRRKLSAASKASQPAASNGVHDSERRPSKGSTILAGARSQASTVYPHPRQQQQPLRPSPPRPRSPSVTLPQINRDGGARSVLARPPVLPATDHPKKTSLRPVQAAFHRSPPPRSEQLTPSISTPHNAVQDPSSAEAVVDLCTPSPEPPRNRPPSPPRTSAAKPKRPNPFASFAFDPSIHGSANGRPTKKRRLDADDSPASSLAAPAARPVSPQAFRTRNDFKTSRPSSSKTASAVALAKELADDTAHVVDLTVLDEPPPAHLPDLNGGRRPRTPPSAAFVPNGLLGFGRQRGTPPPRRQLRDSDLAPQTPPGSSRPLQAPIGDENMFASSIHSWSSPAVRSLVEHTPLRPNGLLSSPTSAHAHNGVRHKEHTPLRPNGLLGASSSPVLSPVIEVHSSPAAKRSDELLSAESEEDDDEPFFRRPQPRASAKTKRKSMSPPVSPSVEILVEPEIVGPQSYRTRILPKLGSDEMAMPASYRSSFVLELGPGYSIPVRLRDVAAGQELSLPPRLLLHRARMYDARHAATLIRVAGAGRVVPDPRTTSRPAATLQQCVWFLEFYRRLADSNKFLVLAESGDAHRGLVFLSTHNWEAARKLWIPEDLDALPPPDEIFTFDGP